MQNHRQGQMFSQSQHHRHYHPMRISPVPERDETAWNITSTTCHYQPTQPVIGDIAWNMSSTMNTTRNINISNENCDIRTLAHHCNISDLGF